MTTLKRTLDLAARLAIATDTEAILRAAGAVQDAHVALPDGRHAVAVIQAARALADPAAAGALCRHLAARHRDADGTPAVDVVAGPPGDGAVLAFETARQLGVRFAIAGPSPDAAPTGLLPGGARVLLVDLELAPDGGLLAAIPQVEAAGVELVGCAVVADRTEGRAHVVSAVSWASYPLTALWRPALAVEPGPETCPRCAARVPLEGAPA